MKNIFVILLLAFSFSVQAQEVKTEKDFLVTKQEAADLGFADKAFDKAYAITPDCSRADLESLRKILYAEGISGTFQMDNWKYEGDLKQITFISFGRNKNIVCECTTDNLGTLLIVKEGDAKISCLHKK